VAIALLSMSAEDPAAADGGYAGWTVPSEYQPVHNLFRELHIGPYAQLGEVTVGAILREYWHWLLFMVVIVGLTNGRAARIEQLVARRTRQLSEANAQLELQITERRRAEEESRQHQAELAHVYRVGMIGEMASSIAHEINQPLSAIASYAQGCVRRLKDGRGGGGELLEAMQGVSDQAERAGAIVRRIRDFVRKGEPEPREVDLNHVIRDAVHLLESDARRHRTDMVFDLTDARPRIMADGVQLQQVVLNLARNAVEAMADSPGERRLLIATRLAGDGMVELRVGDNGPGLAPEQRDKVFEPFFTTKTRGLGLGLSICRSIVEDHGGRIGVEEAEGGGALFVVRLPVSKEGPKA
jgi:two-component system sensor histidine kinase TtrS